MKQPKINKKGQPLWLPLLLVFDFVVVRRLLVVSFPTHFVGFFVMLPM